MEDNENEVENIQNKEEEKLKELENLQSNIFYLNNTIKDFDLPLSLNEFRTQIKDLFHIESKKNDEIFVIYTSLEEGDNDKEKEETLEAKTDNDYILLLKRIKDDKVKDQTIFIEIDKVPSQISRKEPETFEEEIQNVVERELKAAAENIKKYLSGNKKCYPSAKNRKKNKICSKCYRTIIGDIYKSVTNIDEKIYCEKCSFTQNDPTFIIH